MGQEVEKSVRNQGIRDRFGVMPPDSNMVEVLEGTTGAARGATPATTLIQSEDPRLFRQH